MTVFSGCMLATSGSISMHPESGKNCPSLFSGHRSCLQHSQVSGDHLGRQVCGQLWRESDHLFTHQSPHGPDLHQHLRHLDVPGLHVHRALCVAGHPQHAHLLGDPTSQREKSNVVKSREEGTQLGNNASRRCTGKQTQIN